ncbi:MAG: chemotaxis protein CheW [Croceibacterium sp.]
MSEMMLVVEIAGRRAGVPALVVNSVIELDSVTPVPRAAPHIAGLGALRSRPLTVIDCRTALGAPPCENAAARRAVVVEHGGHLYGLLVDAADDIVVTLADPEPIGSDPGAGWSRVASSKIETETGPLLLLDLAALIAGPDCSLAA